MRKGPGPLLALMNKNTATPKNKKIAMITVGYEVIRKAVCQMQHTFYSQRLQHILP